jgi:hypothetical protein
LDRGLSFGKAGKNGNRTKHRNAASKEVVICDESIVVVASEQAKLLSPAYVIGVRLAREPQPRFSGWHRDLYGSPPLSPLS